MATPTTPMERTSTPTTSTSTNIAYRPVYKHWFYKTTSESKRIWIPFSFPDSMLLEEAFLANGIKLCFFFLFPFCLMCVCVIVNVVISW